MITRMNLKSGGILASSFLIVNIIVAATGYYNMRSLKEAFDDLYHFLYSFCQNFNSGNGSRRASGVEGQPDLFTQSIQGEK